MLTKPSLSTKSIRRSRSTQLRFTLSSAASVTLTLERRASGRRTKSGSCRAVSKANAKGKRCTYYAAVKGRRSISGKTGSNSATLTTRFAGRTLRPGIYRLTVTVKGGNTARLALTVRTT